MPPSSPAKTTALHIQPLRSKPSKHSINRTRDIDDVTGDFPSHEAHTTQNARGSRAIRGPGDVVGTPGQVSAAVESVPKRSFHMIPHPAHPTIAQRPHPPRRASSDTATRRRSAPNIVPPTFADTETSVMVPDSASTHSLHFINSGKANGKSGSSTPNSSRSSTITRVSSSRNSLVSDDVLFDVSFSGHSTIIPSADTGATAASAEPITSPTAPSSEPKDMAKRNKIAHEILDSERRYVDSLLLLQQTFLDPLMAVVGTDAEILPKRVIQCIFSELAGIVNVNTELKRQLEDRIENVSWDPGHGRVGDIFLNMAPFLKMYSSYVKNFNSALSTVEDLTAKVPAFADFVAKKNKVCHGLNLQSYLILPVQRIPRYKLLLEDLMKHTDVEHPDQPTLKQSLNRISEVAVFVNETIREHEMMQSLIDVQRSLRGLREDLVSPGRRLIHKGTVQKICRKRHQTRHLILLSDYLIYSSPGLLEDQYIFHRKLDLELCEVIDVPDTQDLRHIFQIVSPEKSFAMYTDEAEEKQKWIQAIRRTVRELRSNRSTLRNEGDRLTARERKKKLHNYSAPVWVPDDAAHSCMVCSQEFSVLKRKHHCRACGKVVCHICSSRYFIIPGLEKDHPARACNPCYERISQEGKLQVVPTDATSPPTSPVSPNSPSSPISLTSSAPLASPPLPSTSPADDTSTRPRPRPSGARRVRPVSMAPQLWSMLGKNFIEHTGPLSPTSSTRPRAPSEVSSSAGVRECSLCRDTFSLMKWKYLCAKCGRSMCSDCASKKSQMQLCDPCYHGLSPLNIIVDERGGGWSAPCVDDDIDERKDVASEVIVPACN